MISPKSRGSPEVGVRGMGMRRKYISLMKE
jgi:hypothetical protein